MYYLCCNCNWDTTTKNNKKMKQFVRKEIIRLRINSKSCPRFGPPNLKNKKNEKKKQAKEGEPPRVFHLHDSGMTEVFLGHFLHRGRHRGAEHSRYTHLKRRSIETQQKVPLRVQVRATETADRTSNATKQ